MTPEQARELKQLYDELSASTKNLEDHQKALDEQRKLGNIGLEHTTAKLADVMSALQKNSDHYKELAEKAQKHADNITTAGSARKKQLEAEAEQWNNVHTELSAIGVDANIVAGEFDKVLDVAKKSQVQVKNATKDMGTLMERQRQIAENYAKTFEKIEQSNKVAWDPTDMGSYGEMLKGLAAGAMGFAQEITGYATRTDLLLMNALFAGGGFGMQTVFQNLQKYPTQLDESFRKVVKTTGLFSEGMKTSFIDIINPMEMAQSELAKIPPPLVDVGINAQDSAAAMQSLIKNTMLFRPAFMDANRGVTAFVGSTVAGLAKMGVTTDTSTQTLDIFNKALKQSPLEATRSTKQLVTMADTLGIDVNQAMADFNANMKNLSQYGDDAIKVFANLEAQAVATGVKVGELAGLAEKLDTFKGAATAGQQLNAVLGGTFLSITDLVHAEPAEKIEMLKEAVSRAGLSFDTMNRRMKLVVTQAAGLGTDTLSAARIFGSEGAFAKVSEGMSTATMSGEQFSQRVNQTMTRAEQLEKGMGRLAGGFQKWVDRTRKTAVLGSNLMLNSFEKILNKTGESEKAMLSFMAAFQPVAVLAGKAGSVGPLAAIATALGVGAVAGAEPEAKSPGSRARRRESPRGALRPMTPATPMNVTNVDSAGTEIKPISAESIDLMNSSMSALNINIQKLVDGTAEPRQVDINLQLGDEEITDMPTEIRKWFADQIRRGTTK